MSFQAHVTTSGSEQPNAANLRNRFKIFKEYEINVNPVELKHPDQALSMLTVFILVFMHLFCKTSRRQDFQMS